MADQTQFPPRSSKVPSGLEATIGRIKKEFVQKLLAQSNVSSLDPKEIRSLLSTYYRTGQSPSGLIAQTRQKILVIAHAEAVSANLKNGDTVKVPHSAGELEARVKRISEYPNAPAEFKDASNLPIFTLTVLIEWEGTPDFIDEVTSVNKGTNAITIIDQAEQADNFIINPRNPISEPDPPIRSLVLGSGLLELPLAKSDYSADVYGIITSALPDYPDDTIKVVVSDTGLKLKIHTPCGQQNELPQQKYTTWDGKTTYFPIAPNPNGVPSDLNPIGFCSLTNYLDDTYPMPPRNASFLTGIPTDDGMVLRNPNDDHHGRHGTCIAAIVAQNPAGASAIIPLKIFDFLGFGTLFDILCGFNYIFSRIEAGENIRIINASWGAAVPKKGTDVYRLLERKIEELQKRGVFLLAAAGNRDSIDQTIGRNLSDEPAVPACYSATYDNVITVTTVVENWKEVFYNRMKRSRYINRDLHKRLLASGNWLEWFLNLFVNIIPDGYTAVENYSSQYVQVGVVAHPIGGIFPMPFGSPAPPPLAGSSFATAYMSAYVVRYLKNNPNATRAEILASLSTHASLEAQVQQGRYLELDTVTRKSIEANFKSVLHAILSTFT
ncbi:S8 family serine peptidase [Salmonirosea aquatica]|uniref:S8 family serine peptidase n=1 Tax=Salmonirosea aquatica TaxID=2654236 RepID=A0A7C9FP11_9BACT|nr:S8 family serine peptidase [Cytophagaceae bacterium SJW1-29]